MPRKTKKQKLITELHRKEKLIKSLKQKRISSKGKETVIKPEPSDIMIDIINKRKNEKLVTDTSNSAIYQWVSTDLRRIIILSLLAFSFEAVVYWAVMK